MQLNDYLGREEMLELLTLKEGKKGTEAGTKAIDGTRLNELLKSWILQLGEWWSYSEYILSIFKRDFPSIASYDLRTWSSSVMVLWRVNGHRFTEVRASESYVYDSSADIREYWIKPVARALPQRLN